STKATRYAGPVSIQANAKAFARRLNGATWSGPTVRSFSVQKPTLAISEIMYHPAGPPDGSALTESDFEFIEIQNTGSAAVALQGVTLSGGIQFTFGARTLEADAYIAVAKNPAAFQSRYGASIVVEGPFAGELNNAGDTITLT